MNKQIKKIKTGLTLTGPESLTWYWAAQNLHPHTHGAIPALWQDADITCHYRLHKLRQHWGVFIRVTKE